MTTSTDTIRDDLRRLVEQLAPVVHYRFDELVDTYIKKYGAKQFSEIEDSMVKVLDLVDAHRIDMPVAGPCPSWCEMEHGHRYHSYDPETGQEIRNHGRRLSEHVDLTLEEWSGEPLFSRPIVLMVSVDPDDMTAAQARELAAELLDAADELDKVTNGDDRWTEDEL
jgi:hypothetical protein